MGIKYRLRNADSYKEIEELLKELSQYKYASEKTKRVCQRIASNRYDSIKK